MALIPDPLSCFQTLHTIKTMVIDILEAKAQLGKVTTETKELLGMVEYVGPWIDSLQAVYPKSNDAVLDSELLRPHLHSLGVKLVEAHLKLQTLQAKSDRIKEGNKVWQTAKAYFGQGATSQNKKTAEIRGGISRSLDGLMGAIIVLSYRGHVNLIAAWNSRQPPAGAESSCKSYSLSEPDEALLKRVNTLASNCLDDEGYTVEVEICPSHSNDFRNPRREEQKAAATGSADGLREVIEGGYEVSNLTKIRFKINVNDERFLIVVTYDHRRPPTLFFPTLTKHVTEISSDSNYRLFPDQTANDPRSIKIRKDASLGADEIGEESIYVVLSPHQLVKSQDEETEFALEDLHEHLENIDQRDVFVKHFAFDIK